MRATGNVPKHRWLLVGMIVLAVLAIAGPAAAQTVRGANDDQVVLTGSLVVPEGQTVHTAVIFDGPATIAGTVAQSVVVFHGDVEITGTVGKDVVVFDGDVTVRSGAEVGGNLVSRATPTVEQGATVRGSTQRIVGRYDVGDIGLISKIAWWIGYSASALILGLILLVVAPTLDFALARATRERTGGVIGVGVGWFFLLPLAAILLLVTVVGIPLGLFTLLALALLYTVGYVAGALTVGRLLMKPPTSRFLAFLVGLAILRALALIPVVAGLLFTVTAIVGFGAMVVSARRKPSEAEVSPTAPPPPTPPVPAT